MSDWAAQHTGAASAIAGLDMVKLILTLKCYLFIKEPESRELSQEPE
jgi:hypothetical protein